MRCVWVKRSTAEMQRSQMVKSFCNAVKWSCSKRESRFLDPGRSCDYGVYGSVTSGGGSSMRLGGGGGGGEGG